jgi:hypothetical protein
MPICFSNPTKGEWTRTVADFTGTMRGSMKGSDGKLIAPTKGPATERYATRTNSHTVEAS